MSAKKTTQKPLRKLTVATWIILALAAACFATILVITSQDVPTKVELVYKMTYIILAINLYAYASGLWALVIGIIGLTRWKRQPRRYQISTVIFLVVGIALTVLFIYMVADVIDYLNHRAEMYDRLVDSLPRQD